VDPAAVGDREVLEVLAASVANASGPVALSDAAVEAMMAEGSDDDVSSSPPPPPRLILLLLTMLLLVGVPLIAGAPMETLGVFSAGVGVGSSPSVAVTVC
jgi:hypothetical protein